MQNTIVKEFKNNPKVITLVFDQGGSHGETLSWLQAFWDRYYLRGRVLFDNAGTIGGTVYGQPDTGLPFGRGFIIGPDGIIDSAYFGHRPGWTIERIYELLDLMSVESQEEAASSVPGIALRQNDPNPFSPCTTIRFELAEERVLSLQVFDIAGRLVRTLIEHKTLGSGPHVQVWEGKDDSGRDVGSGVYLYRLGSADCAVSRRLTLLR
ncbi:hypothetical protein ACFL6M_01385 [Candidatus Eisenbacteria bacterium]|uniref:FlgD Ig-like domain-containing protein n=1 Tax=Eiseniibacteriota bacterium TaxID=2212470 RepID=A0ABV6YIS1_UNCEI